MSKMYKVTVKGTGQLNGPVNINKTVEMEEQMAIKFNGADRYRVIEEFVKLHYPGVKIPSIRGFGASVVPIKQEKTSKISEQTSENIGKNKDKSFSSFLIGVADDLIASNTNTDNEHDDLEAEKRRLELEYLREEKEYELEKKQKIDKENLKKEKKEKQLKEAEEYLNNGGNRIFYYLKRFWISLDKPWKKILLFFVLFILLIFANDFFNKNSDKRSFDELNNRFNELVIQTENEISKKNNKEVTLLIDELKKMINESHIDNEFLIDYQKSIKADWEFKLKRLESKINNK